MNEITLKLSVEETNSVLNVLGELPTKSGAYPLVQKILEQAKAQTEQATEVTA